MLNELLVLERGLRRAGVVMTTRHSEIKNVRRMPTLLVRLDADGRVVAVRPVGETVPLWTLRDGQKNSFPFVQLREPFWDVPSDNPHRIEAGKHRSGNRRRAVLTLAQEALWNGDRLRSWPDDALLRRVRERGAALASLNSTDAASVPRAMERFARACDRERSGGSQELLQQIAGELLTNLEQVTDDEWTDVAVAILLEGSGAFMFDADLPDSQSVLAAHVVAQVSEALQTPANDASAQGAHCALTGQRTDLLTGNFPQPNLPLLGQTYLFARNRDTPAAGRYGQYGAAAMPVGTDVVVGLSAALTAIAARDLRGKTWREIPSAAPKQSDLLLAFVEAAPDVPLADILGDDGDDTQAADDGTAPVSTALSVARFEKRCERLLLTVKGEALDTPTRYTAQIVILRKVDPANRKVVCADSPTVGQLYSAGQAWVAGERAVPEWLRLPVTRPGERKPQLARPPHIAPLSLTAFSRQLYIRDGTDRQEVRGIGAAEALDVFLYASDTSSRTEANVVRRILRLVLTRRTTLVAAVAHDRRRFAHKSTTLEDNHEALRTVTVLSILLSKLGRTASEPGEGYMTSTAFQFGQLLAVADAVHAGYCADVRSGHMPPSLLGNQVFAMAQTAPARALSTLCRRWKPYAGWAKQRTNERMPARFLDQRGRWKADGDIPKEHRAEFEREKVAQVALAQARRASDLAAALTGRLPEQCNDVFRAELLLGYIAGLPKVHQDGEHDEQPATNTPPQEG